MRTKQFNTNSWLKYRKVLFDECGEAAKTRQITQKEKKKNLFFFMNAPKITLN